MNQNPIDVFGLGQSALDFLGTASAYPPPDTKCELNELLTQGGGPVATALCALSRWGHHCVFSSILGDDEYGTRIKESLKQEGVDISQVVIRPESLSQIAFILVQPDNGQRTIFWRRPTGQPLSPEEVPEEYLQRARVLHTDGLLIDAALKAARTAQRYQIPTVVDAGTLRDGMLELARESNVFLASEKFGQALTGGDSPDKACQKLAELGPDVTAITLGERGFVARINGKPVHMEAYPAQPVDTTGAGDTFHAGFIHGLLSNWDAEKSLAFGAWTAARVVEHIGGRAGIPAASDFRYEEAKKETGKDQVH